MRIAHATDIHWFVPPALSRLAGKRSFGTTSLYLRGRRHHFDPTVQQQLVRSLLDAEPDLVVLTGDLTAQALPEEFELARRTLDPLLQRLPTLVQNGNHDVYTGGAMREGRLAATFGPWLHRIGDDPIARVDLGEVTVLGLDPCRPHWSASGRLPSDQLARLRQLLDDPALAERSVLLAQHYPVVNPIDEPYDNPYHGLRNARELMALLDGVKVRPLALLHGHKHHGYRARLPNGTPTLNPGSSGYAHDPPRARAAHFNVYTVQDGTLADVTRFRHDGTTFVPLDGDPYP